MLQMGICMLLHLILKLSCQCLNARVAHVPPSLTPSILSISPMGPSASWTSWCMYPPGPDMPGGFPQCGQPCGQPMVWHAPRLRHKVGTRIPSREWQAHLHWEGQATPLKSLLSEKLYSDWKEITFIILPLNHSYLWFFFFVVPLFLSICLQSPSL